MDGASDASTDGPAEADASADAAIDAAGDASTVDAADANILDAMQPDAAIDAMADAAVDPVGNCGLTALEWTADGTGNESAGRYNLAIAGGTVSYVSGKFGQAWSFPSTGGGYLHAANVAGGFMDQLGSRMTIEAWIYLDAVPGSARIVDKITAGVLDGILLDIYPAKMRLLAGSLWLNPGTASIPTGQWVHVAATYDGGLGRIYQNGVKVAEHMLGNAPALPINTRELRIGADSVGANRFVGKIDDVRIYCKALTPAEVMARASR